MARVGDILFCYALLTAVVFQALQYAFSSFLFLMSGDREHHWMKKCRMVARGEDAIEKYYVIELLPLFFIINAPVAVAVSATDSEYAGVAILLSIASLGKLGSDAREKAGYKTPVERGYRYTLIVVAVFVLTVTNGLQFLRSDVRGLHLDKPQKGWHFGAHLIIHDWTTVVACIVTLVPVNRFLGIGWNTLGHAVKVAITLTVLLFERRQVNLTCEPPSYPCAVGKLTRWLWSPASERLVMALLLVSTMAGDLSWRPQEKEKDEDKYLDARQPDSHSAADTV